MVKDIQLRVSLKEEEIPDILLIKSAEWLSIPVGTSQFIPVHESQVFNTANLMPTSLGQAQTWAQQAAANHHIYRMKGFVKDAQKTWLIQVVGDQIDIQQVSAGDNGLVVIGTDVKAVVWA